MVVQTCTAIPWEEATTLALSKTEKAILQDFTPVKMFLYEIHSKLGEFQRVIKVKVLRCT